MTSLTPIMNKTSFAPSPSQQTGSAQVYSLTPVMKKRHLCFPPNKQVQSNDFSNADHEKNSLKTFRAGARCFQGVLFMISVSSYLN